MTPWIVADQAPLSLGFSEQEYWSGLPGTPTFDLPSPGMALVSLMPPASAGRFLLPLVPPGKPLDTITGPVFKKLETRHKEIQ